MNIQKYLIPCAFKSLGAIHSYSLDKKIQTISSVLTVIRDLKVDDGFSLLLGLLVHKFGKSVIAKPLIGDLSLSQLTTTLENYIRIHDSIA